MRELPIRYKKSYDDDVKLFTKIVFPFIYAMLILILVFTVYSNYFVESGNVYVRDFAVYYRVDISGYSMESTLHDGDYVYMSKGAKPDKGDIVVVKTPKKVLIKRVIALGGERVKLVDGKLFINDVKIEEPYVSAENNTASKNNYDEILVPQGTMFCLGDNRNNSKDSRSPDYGCMPLDWVMGVVADWSI